MTVNSGFKERVMAGKYVICDTRLRSAKCKLQLPVFDSSTSSGYVDPSNAVCGDVVNETKGENVKMTTTHLLLL